MRAPTRQTRPGFALELLWYGTLWGATEATIGGLLHIALPPTYPGKIMIAIAAGLMIFAARRTGKPWFPLGMAVVAAPLKLFSAAVFSLPITAPAVVNPAFSILAQGLAFSLILAIAYKVRLPAYLRFGLAGASAVALQSFLYLALVKYPGLLIYPPRELLETLGTKFPHWAFSVSGTLRFLGGTLPYSVLAAGIASLLVGAIPLSPRRTTRPALLASGAAICLSIFFLSSWLI